MTQVDERTVASTQVSPLQRIPQMVRSLFIGRSSSLHTQVFRFMLAGALATVGDTTVLVALVKFAGMDYRVAGAIAFTIGCIISYVMSVRWVFIHRNISNRTLEFVVFITIGAVGLGLTVLIMHTCVTYLHMHYLTGKATAIVTVFTWNFGARRMFMFRPTKNL